MGASAESTEGFSYLQPRGGRRETGVYGKGPFQDSHPRAAPEFGAGFHNAFGAAHPEQGHNALHPGSADPQIPDREYIFIQRGAG